MRVYPHRLLAGVILAAALLVTACGDDESGMFRVENTDFSAEEEFTIEVEAADRTTFSLTGVNGTIEVAGEPGATSLRVSGVRRVESESVEDAERSLADLKVEHTATEAGLSVRTVQPERTEGRHYLVDYTVTLPSAFEVTVANVNGATVLQSVEGFVTVDNMNGTISLSDVSGGMKITQKNGPVSASAAVPAGGSIEITTTNGGIGLEIPTSTSATLSARVGLGSISYSNLNLTNLLQTSNSLSGTLRKGSGAILLAASVGEIQITGGAALDETAVFPLDTYFVIQEFAAVNRSFGNRYHAAEDAHGEGGTPVYAIADGVVSFSGEALGYGWLIAIDHPVHDVYSLYGHLSARRSKIAEGAVRKGDLIGYLADDDEDGSGGSYPDWGPHLHFAVRSGSRADYPSTGDDDRWMAGYTYAHPTTHEWLDPSDFVLGHSE